MCAGVLEGAAVGSTEITFWPGQLNAGRFKADVQTAGSCMLLAQAALPCALLAAHQPAIDAAAGAQDAATRAEAGLELKGGTDAAMAPPLGYTQHVLLPTLERLLGTSVQAECAKRGFFPQVNVLHITSKSHSVAPRGSPAWC